jgi:hypothetical protein
MTAKMALRAIPGQLFAGQIFQERLSEEAAKHMFRKAVADFTPDKILKLAVTGKPKVDRTDKGAKLTIHYTATGPQTIRLAFRTGNVVPRKGLRVRIPCPPLL